MASHTAPGPFGVIPRFDPSQAPCPAPLPAPVEPARPQRRRTWDLAGNLHCSIIGTCLTTTDVRHLLRKLKDPDADRADEHALHVRAVRLASDRDIGGRLLNKALDRRHETILRRFARARTAEEVRALWRAAEEAGDIPGAYWAVMSHPATDQALVHDAFGTVHMLSHLVGRASRADLKRLRALEAAVEARDAEIATLGARLRAETAERIALAARLAQAEQEGRTARAVAAAGRPVPEPVPPPAIRRAGAETARIATLDAQLGRARGDLADWRGRAEALDRELAATAAELAQAEAAIAAMALDGESGPDGTGGMALLYVGGRPGLAAGLRRLAPRIGVEVATHDGGIEDALTLLPGLIGRAEAVLFPVDCVSHAAAEQVKRHCAALGRPFLPLRSASLAGFLAALPGLRARIDAA